MEKGLTMRGSQTPVQKYWHKLLKMIEDGTVKPSIVLTHEGPLEVAPHFYKIFDNKEDGCIRVRSCIVKWFVCNSKNAILYSYQMTWSAKHSWAKESRIRE